MKTFRILSLAALSSMVLFTPVLTNASWYIGAGAKQTKVETESIDASAATSPSAIDDNDSGWKVFGGWEFHPNFAAEFGYADLGKYREHVIVTAIPIILIETTTEMEATAWFGELVGRVDVGGNTRLFGKLGLGYWDVDASLKYLPFVSDSGSGNGFAPVVGAGVQYRPLKLPLAFRLEWEQFRNVGDGVSFFSNTAANSELNGLDINLFGIAVSYKFR